MSKEKMSEQRWSYAWVILIVCMLIQAVPFGIAKNTLPQFISFVCEGEGFSLASFGTVFTVGVVISALVSPFIGRMFDNPAVNKKILFTVGGALAGGGFAMYAFCHSLPAFYGASAIVEVGCAIISSIGIPVMIQAWMPERRAMALGIAFAGGGIGNVVLQQIVPRMLERYGHGYTYLVLGVVSMAVAVPASLFFIRMPGKERSGETDSDTSGKWGYSFSELMKIPMFWVFAVGWIFVGLYVSGMTIQFMAYFVSLGYSTSARANIGSVFALFSIAGNIFGGAIFAKLGEKKGLTLAYALLIAGAVSLLLAPYSVLWGYFFAVALGIAIYSYIIGPSYLTASLFGSKYYGTIVGIVTIFFAMGFAVGSVVFGLVAKNGENYTGAWIYNLICVLIASALILAGTGSFLKRARERRAVETAEEKGV